MRHSAIQLGAPVEPYHWLCHNLDKIPNWCFKAGLWLADEYLVDIRLAEGALLLASVWKPFLCGAPLSWARQ